jgi:hypothetical protein
MLAIFYQTAWARVPEDDEELVCADFSDYWISAWPGHSQKLYLLM